MGYKDSQGVQPPVEETGKWADYNSVGQWDLELDKFYASLRGAILRWDWSQGRLIWVG